MNERIPKVSIIIPTRNRKDSVKETLFSLARLDYPRNKYEVVLIDDGSTDGTEKMLAKIRHILPYSIQYKRLKAEKGLSAARNMGIQMTNGEVLIFTDDDCLFEKGWLTLLLTPFDSHEVGVVGGPDRTPGEASFFCKCVGYIFTSFIGTGGLRGGDRFRLGRYYPKGCNMAVLREAIDKVGGFDELLGPGEEVELGYRIGKAGYQIKYAPSAFVWHKRRSTLKAFLQKVFSIGYTRVVLAHKHRGLLEIGHMIPFIGVLTVFSLLILSLIFPDAIKVLSLMATGYLLVLLLSGVQALFRIKDIRALFMIPLLVALHHSTHGIGYLVAGAKHLLGFKNIYQLNNTLLRKWISMLVLIPVILYASFYISSHRGEFARLLTLSVWQYVILSSLVLSGIVINGLIMKILVEFLGVRLRTVEWLGLSAITSAGNYLFFRGGALTKALYLKKMHRFPFTDFLSAFGVVHCISFLITGILGVTGSIILYFRHSIFHPAIFAVFMLVSAFALFLMLSVPEKWPFRIKSVTYLDKVSKTWWMIKQNRTIMAKLTVASTSLLLIKALRLWLAYRFLSYEAVFNKALLLALLGSISVLLGVVPAGLGIREAVIGFSSKLLGGQVSIGVTAASLNRAVAIIWLSLLGIISAYVLSGQAVRSAEYSTRSVHGRSNR